jgi:hypothetical protein
MEITKPTETLSPVTVSAPARPLNRDGESPLRPGQIIQVTVAQAGEKKVCLEWNGQRIEARTHIGLQQGQRLTLQVAGVSPRIELQPLGLFAPGKLAGLLPSFNSRWQLAALLNGLRQALPDPALPEGMKARTALRPLLDWLQSGARMPDGTVLAKLLQQLGVVRLSDRERGPSLRSALAELPRNLPELPDETAQQAARLLQSLDLARLCNPHLLANGSLLLPLPLPFLDHGYLLIDREKPSTRSPESDPQKLTLLLSLRQLGALRIDMLWGEQDMMLKFTCDTPDTTSFLATFEDELRQILDFRPPGKIYFVTGQAAAGDELIGRLQSHGRAFVDARI